MKESTASRNTHQGFTLIELLVVIAIIAILAAILFPVFAQAKVAAKTTATSSNLRQIGLGTTMYSGDYDETVLPVQQNPQDNNTAWAVQLMPYAKSRAIFFDPARPGFEKDSAVYAPSTYKWNAVVNLAMNQTGYSGYYGMATPGCTGRQTTAYYYGGRNLSGMVSPEKRVAFAPNSYPGVDTGWYLFRTDGNFSATWTNPTVPNNFWNNMVVKTGAFYSGGSIPVVHADGSAGKLKATRDFVTHQAAPNTAAYCKWMANGGSETWGNFWDAS